MEDFRQLQRERWQRETASRQAEEERIKNEAIRADEEYAREVAAKLEEEQRQAVSERECRDFELARRLQAEEAEIARNEEQEPLSPPPNDASPVHDDTVSHPTRVERLVDPVPVPLESQEADDFELARRLQQAEFASRGISRGRQHDVGGGEGHSRRRISPMSLFPFGFGERMGLGMGGMGMSSFGRMSRLFDGFTEAEAEAGEVGSFTSGDPVIRQFETPRARGREVRFNDGDRMFQFQTFASNSNGFGQGRGNGRNWRRPQRVRATGRQRGPGSGSGSRGGGYTYEFPQD